MDFFGSLTDALDSIIPESEDVISVFDDAADFLLGDADSRQARSSGGSQQTSRSSGSSLPKAEKPDDFDAIAIGKGIVRESQKGRALESVDPRRIQAEWMQRLRTFAMDKEARL